MFDNQTFNTNYDYGVRSAYVFSELTRDLSSSPIRTPLATVRNLDAREINFDADCFIRDPPYADAINYHEITEPMIGFLKRGAPPAFGDWIWDSRRPLAIKGKDEHFRRDMVAAYSAMAKRMPDNGLQVVMFTHQDAGVWAISAQYPG
jgi:putative DNA methylase